MCLSTIGAQATQPNLLNQLQILEQGMNNPPPRMRMIDGFNEGWIEFAGESRKGQVELVTVLKELLICSGG